MFLRGWIYACAHVLVGYVESLFLYIKSRHILLTSSRLNSPSASSFNPSRCKNGWTHTHAEKRESDISKLRMFYCRRPCKWYDYKHTYTSYTKQLTTINKQDKANNNNKEKQTQKERTSRHTHPRNSNNKKGYTPSMETNLLSTTTSCRMRTIGKKDSLHPQLWSKEGRKCTMEITHILDHHIQDLNFRSRKRNVRMIILRDVYFNSRWI